MTYERRAKLFINGRSQAVRIPREFEMPGEEVRMHKEGDRLVLEPVEKKQSLSELLDTLKPLTEDFPEIPELPIDPVDL